MPKERLPAKKEANPVRGDFKPCGTELQGGFDYTGQNPNGSTCIGGMRTWWHYTSPTAPTRERVSGKCRCLRDYLEGQKAEPPIEKLPFVDGKSKSGQ
jgi:hypothetical protein